MKPHYRAKPKTSTMPTLLFLFILILIIGWKLIPIIFLALFITFVLTIIFSS